LQILPNDHFHLTKTCSASHVIRRPNSLGWPCILYDLPQAQTSDDLAVHDVSETQQQLTDSLECLFSVDNQSHTTGLQARCATMARKRFHFFLLHKCRVQSPLCRTHACFILIHRHITFLQHAMYSAIMQSKESMPLTSTHI